MHHSPARWAGMSDLFVPGTIPAAPSLSVTEGGFAQDHHSNYYSQEVRITNNGTSPVSAPLWLVLDNLSTNAALANADGTTEVLAPLGSPCIKVPMDDRNSNILRPHETATVTLEFLNSGGGFISYDMRVLDVTPAP
jgi:hypothetical protein